jgi:hypothetical protein
MRSSVQQPISKDKNVMARTRKYYLKKHYLTLRSKVKVPFFFFYLFLSIIIVYLFLSIIIVYPFIVVLYCLSFCCQPLLFILSLLTIIVYLFLSIIIVYLLLSIIIVYLFIVDHCCLSFYFLLFHRKASFILYIHFRWPGCCCFYRF